ncbi:PREDICTED: uncharacterized protein LOC105456705 [Wasmannia auropunctata]|uniref:uncharacterized protein LOC105456705 n=1 Tax=Wasmannia auropunctata TaxID=64793 RepID=UPI0005F0504A|nr:PREDICTED: uncharacterized protein LOC105456705 [Wasmannia auropunctata]
MTVTKTLPPMKIYRLSVYSEQDAERVNSKLDETGNKLDFGDDDRDDENMLKRVVVPNNDPDADLDIFKSASPSKVKNDVHDQQQRRTLAHSGAGPTIGSDEILQSITPGYHYLQTGR